MNDPLDALRPLHEPSAISWWPPAPGWWLLLLIFLIFVLLVMWWWKRTALRRIALSELKKLPAGQSPSQQAAAINRLLKRYALACWPGIEVASLTGELWLQFLDKHGGNGQFMDGPGRALLTQPYSSESQSIEELMHLAHCWLKTNTPRRNQ